MTTLTALVYEHVFTHMKTLVEIPVDQIIRGVGQVATFGVDGLVEAQKRCSDILYIAEKLEDGRYIIDSSQTTYDEARKYGWIV